MKKQNKKYKDDKSAYLTGHLLNFVVVRVPGDQGTAHNNIANLWEHDGVEDFDLAPNDIMKVEDSTGAAIKASDLNRLGARRVAGTTDIVESGHFTKPISAYYLPFKAGEGHTMQLGANADYFFTPTLNGCTFVCGTGNNPQVSHLNLQNINGQIDQTAMNNMALAIHGANTQFYVRRADYKDLAMGQSEDLQCMVVGFRGHTRWVFYRQRYKLDFGVTPWLYTLRDVTQLN